MNAVDRNILYDHRNRHNIMAVRFRKSDLCSSVFDKKAYYYWKVSVSKIFHTVFGKTARTILSQETGDTSTSHETFQRFNLWICMSRTTLL